MGTITIARQLGSLGSEVAHTVADRLSYRVVGRELINEAARRAGTPEAALAAIDELRLLGICPSPQACQAYRDAVAQVMEELAAAGNVVIIGRAGQVILRGRPDVVHVRVIAPVQIRAERIAHRCGVSIASAQAQIEASDRFRRNYLKRFYHIRWDDPELYDLIINTERVTPKVASMLIVQTISHRTQTNKAAFPGQEPALEPV